MPLPANPPPTTPSVAKAVAPRWQRLAVYFGTLAFAAILLGSALAPQRDPQERLRKHSAPPPAVRQQIQAVAVDVDAALATDWKPHGIQPTERASDLLVMRRLSLALRGTIPSLEEIRLFESLPANERLEWWLADIFADRRYADYTAERFARAWVGVEDGPFLVFRRRRFVLWISEQFQKNRPFDETVRELVTASGLWTENPAVNFLTATVINDSGDDNPRPNRLASQTARAFLGVRMDCAECHDHPFDDRWTQRGFEGLAAFFAPARQSPGKSISGIQDDSEYQYTVIDRVTNQPRNVRPAVPFGEEWLPQEGSTRQRFAAWLTDRRNSAFARATANRAWALMFGRPLVEPVDDVPINDLTTKAITAYDHDAASSTATNQPDIPAPQRVIELLAEDYSAHDYDLQRLFRVIASTAAFQRESRRTPPLNEPAPTAEQVVQQRNRADVQAETVWAEFPLQRLRPEQMIGGLIQAGTLRTIDEQSHIFTQLIRFFRERDFVQRYGDAGADEFADRGGTIPQSLLLMNGDLARELIQPELLNASTRIAQFSNSHRQAIEATYLTMLTRRPSDQEIDYFERVWKDREPELGKQQLVYDLSWALMNSTEFRWNH